VSAGGEIVELCLAGAQEATSWGRARRRRWLGEGAWGPVLSWEKGLGRPTESREFHVKAGLGKPFVDGGSLGGVQGLDEFVGRAAVAARLAAAAAEEELSAEAW
jgi:hypothetical protein